MVMVRKRKSLVVSDDEDWNGGDDISDTISESVASQESEQELSVDEDMLETSDIRQRSLRRRSSVKKNVKGPFVVITSRAGTKRAAADFTRRQRAAFDLPLSKRVKTLPEVTSPAVASPSKPTPVQSPAAAWKNIFKSSPQNATPIKKRVQHKPVTGTARKKQKLNATDFPPIQDIPAMFFDMVKNLPESATVAKRLQGRKLRVATMCSGTESPLLALGQISRSIERHHGIKFEIDHVFSCEIEPFKQAYIERNFSPPILFRDVCELANPEATTAYGSLVKVPNVKVDLLIAGTSCVDYSNLNNKKKGIHAGGESGRTFWGMLTWVKTYRPKLVILENVCGADWTSMQNEFTKIRYRVTATRFDTKDYYIPHTRTRGYLFATAEGPTNLPEMWINLVKSMQRPASSPLEAFLLPTDDPRVHQARLDLARASVDRRAARTDWERCESRHERQRIEEGLGIKRPFSRWEPNSVCRFPDYAWNDWGTSQSTRVLDSIDILYLKMAVKGIDAMSKTLVWELSQNVDRINTNVRPGICPCLTPRVIPFVTSRGGPVVGREALNLQGIPVDELLLTRESERNLHDLAGNAMTTTVVGACMLAALVVSLDALEPGSGVPPKQIELDPFPTIAGDDQLNELPLELGTYANMSLEDLVADADQSSRQCDCEGRTGVTKETIRKCRECWATSCVKCGIRPEHYYEQVTSDNRLSPTGFEKELRSALPMRLHLQGITLDALETLKSQHDTIDLNGKDWTLWHDAVVTAVKNEFRFRSVKRQEYWIVTYDAPMAILELIIDPHQPVWQLTIKAPEDEPVNGRLRSILATPAARMYLDLKSQDTSFFTGTWQVCFPASKSFTITVTGRGELVESWEARIGLQNHLTSGKWWSQLEISGIPADARVYLDRDLSGTYDLLEKCGTAMNALHKKRQASADEQKLPLFLFFDPQPCGEQSGDTFIFSTNARRLPYGEIRVVNATLDPKWRPSSVDGPQSVACHVKGKWATLECARLVPTTEATLQGTVSTPAGPLHVSCEQDACKTATAVLTCKVPLTHAESVWPRDKWEEIDLLHRGRSTFESLAWITERIKGITALQDWMDVPGVHDIDDRGKPSPCERCAPTPPELIWIRRGTSASAFEDPQQAGAYEQNLKRRPGPFVAQFRLDGTLGMLRLGVNVASLVHRALSRLPSKDRPESPKVSWRLTTEFTDQEEKLKPLEVKSNKLDPEHEQPPHFERFKLRKEQSRSLTWMVRQEQTTIEPFVEEEVSEAVLEPLGWRAEAKAERQVFVRGGVLADQVGYGKTAITLGLIDYAASLPPPPPPPPSHVKGRIPIKATLIIVPSHLVAQWPAEIKKFTGNRFKVLTMLNVANFNKTTVADFEQADIIICARSVLTGINYWSNLSGLAGSELLPVSEGRYFNIRYREALEKLKNRVKELTEIGGKEGVQLVIQAVKEGLLRRKQRGSDETVPVQKQVRGTKAYRDQLKAKIEETSQELNDLDDGDSSDSMEKRKTPKSKNAGTTSREDKDPWYLQTQSVQKNWKKMQCPPLEMFYFNRIVVDEYTYVTGKDYACILELRSNYRWVLSGTSPVHEFATVKTIASFLGLHLGVDDDAEIGEDMVKKRLNERTAAEKFHSFREVHTAAWHARRHAVAQTFLDGFVRQNIAEIDEILCEEYIVPIQLPPAELALYYELQHYLLSVEMNVRKTVRAGKAAQGDRELRLGLALEKMKSPEQALLIRCSHFDLELRSSGHDGKKQQLRVRNAAEACEKIVIERKAQLEECRQLFEEHVNDAKALHYWILEHGGYEEGDDLPLERWWGQALAGRSDDVDAGLLVAEIVKNMGQLGAKKGKGKENMGDTSLKPVGNTIKKTQQNGAKKKMGSSKRNSADDDFLDDDEDEDTGKPKKAPTLSDKKWELREHTHRLRKVQKELVNRLRSLRYIQAVRDVQTRRQAEAICPKCQKSFHLPDNYDQVVFLSCCGHLGCHTCVLEEAEKETCVTPGCQVAARSNFIVTPESLGVDQDDFGSGHGAKLSAIVSLIKDKIPSKDRILIFVQFPELKQKVSEALDDARISHLKIEGGATKMSKAVERFQNMDDLDVDHDPYGTRVLLLTATNEEASGANLTGANHVIFVSPLHLETPEVYDACETQAIGRVRRYGQTKKVHVWRFICKGTVDEDIWNQVVERRTAV
ncbi:hypothetical protein SpCBS45565_g05673 [Spizellomyces sp. 'palustris']|nr:hypothetical protein SpCBS45565_g05673 [Spizellomyces sp. 'palustris']